MWTWKARDKAGQREPIIVEAPTYLAAKVRACHHFGFLDQQHPNSDPWPETWRVDIEVEREP